MAVLLLVVACGDDEEFEPAPGATVEAAQLDGLIDAALADFELERSAVQPEPMPDGDAGPSCLQVEVGSCTFPRPPGVTVSLQGDDGARVFVRLVLGVDSLEAGDLVQRAEQSRRLEATETLRIFYESAPVPESRIVGPCRQGSDWSSDEGCAWQERDAPDVGDEATAMKSDSLEVTRLSAVAFARESVFADVQVITTDGDLPNGLADDIAGALDEQIKLALSQ